MKCPSCGDDLDREDGNHERKRSGIADRDRGVDCQYVCNDCGLEAFWNPETGLDITFDPRTYKAKNRGDGDTFTAEKFYGAGVTAKIPGEPIVVWHTCNNCKHSFHEAGKCDRCNCGEDELIFSESKARAGAWY